MTQPGGLIYLRATTTTPAVWDIEPLRIDFDPWGEEHAARAWRGAALTRLRAERTAHVERTRRAIGHMLAELRATLTGPGRRWL